VNDVSPPTCICPTGINLAIKNTFMATSIDIDVFEAFLRGDAKGFNLIYIALRDDLIYHGKKINKNKQEVEDIVTDAFERMREKIGTFESGKHIRSFLLKTVIFNSLKKAQGSRRLGDLHEIRLEEYPDPGLSPMDISESEVHDRYRVQVIRDKAEQLPQRRREVFLLHFFEGLRINDIALRMGITPGTVYQNLGYAVKDIQKHLRKKGFPDIPLSLLFLIL